MEKLSVNQQFGHLADDEAIATTKKALEQNGFTVYIAANSAEAKEKALELLPKGAEVMTMSSITLETLGLVKEINESARYDAVKPRLSEMDPKTQAAERRRMGAAPEWSIGSVHALTQDGHLLIASNTGSQLPAYASGAAHVVYIVGAQKIVKNINEGFKRLYEYSFPLEDERAQQAYGMHSAVNKVLVINQETIPNRTTVVIVKEKLGF